MKVKLLTAAIGSIVLASTPTVQAESFVLEEIVVTAQKREQSLQDVPLAVTAYDAQALKAQGIDDVIDLGTSNPSLNFSTGQNKVSNSPIRIRGIGTVGTNAAFEGAVGVYVDGVYRSRSGMVLATFNDIGGVEILRGPQGTLFGKNTTAGAMILNSTRPGQDFEAGGEVTLGNYGKEKASFFVNGAVSDTLSLRASILSDQADGFIDNPATGNDKQNTDLYSVKLQALWEPTAETSVHVIADYSKANETCCDGMGTRIDAPDPTSLLDGFYSGQASLNGLPYFTDDPFDRNNYTNTDGTDKSVDQGIAVIVTHDLTDDLTLKSTTSYREYTNEQENQDSDFGPVDLLRGGSTNEFETFSQEFNLTGSFDLGDMPVEYVAGAFYSNEDLERRSTRYTESQAGANFHTIMNVLSLSPVTPDGDPNPFYALYNAYAGFFNPIELANPASTLPGSDSESVLENEVWALYSHLTFSLTDNLNLVTGLRYSEEEKAVDFNNLMGTTEEYFDYLRQNDAGIMTLGASTTSPDFSESIDEEEWTYSASLQYFPTEDIQLYASYSKGFKAGGISLAGDAVGQLITTEHTYTDWVANGMDYNATPLVLSPELDPTYDPEYVDAYEVGLKATFHDGRGRLNTAIFYSDYQDIQVTTFTGTDFITTNADTAKSQGIEMELDYAVTENLRADIAITYLDDTTYGSSELISHLEGRDQAFAPEFSGAMNLSYSRGINEILEGYANLNISYMGEHFISNDTDYQEEYTLVGGTIGLRSQDGVWDVGLFCRNCFDKEYYNFGFDAPLQAHSPQMGNQGAPRTYGLAVSANF
ncbi:TonB-dependent receptor [Maricurvus nonylphenolicus]|uniref:TonB-dependent receptor n=1 Tax=Maricurvus nonylphenolicus TaxID=1008307 RepID=UPI0036F3DC5E